MASFDENGKYIKTNWKTGDKITATKLNKIEESIEAVNDNDISRHVEADARLDTLEAKDEAHDKELANVKNTIADNKAATDIYVYDINSRMQFLEEEMNDGLADIADMATSINDTITNAKTNLNTIVAYAETNLNDIITDAETNLDNAVQEAEENLNEAIRIAEENLNNGGGNIGPRLDALEASTSSLQVSTSSLQSAVSSLQTELETTVSSLQAELTTTVSSLQAEVSSLQSAVSSLQSAVSSLQSELGVNVSTLESNINSIRGVL